MSVQGPLTAGEAAETGRPVAADEPAGNDDGRHLFRYVVFEEWRDYRAVMATFAGTYFSELTPEEVAARLAEAGVDLDLPTVTARLDRLREWGNLTVSTSIGSPSSLADYYRRRNRYLITRAGQEVHDLVEGVLTRVDEVRDVSTGRLRALRDALEALVALDVALADPTRLADAVRDVFDPHAAFASEITQFFAAINQWQSRYDLDADELRFFAEVLVGYVGERLDDIERAARPIGRSLVALQPRLGVVVERMGRGLAGRVEQAGLQGTVSVSHVPGSSLADWEHLSAWFVGRAGVASRIERLGRDAVAAIRTLTLNLTRLSRVGVGASSRRADFLRLARFADGAEDDVEAHRVLAAAFGLHPPNHYGVLAEDAEDPAPSATSWWDGPRAVVPVAVRARGETTNRGRPSPLPDRSRERALLRWRREEERTARDKVDAELLGLDRLDGAIVSPAALARLQHLLGRSTHGWRAGSTERAVVDGTVRCVVRNRPGASTVVTCADGELTLVDLVVTIEPAGEPGPQPHADLQRQPEPEPQPEPGP